MTVPTGSALNYTPNSQSTLKRVSRSFAPTSNNYKNFREGDEWLDTTNMDWYKLSDITGTTATWTIIGGASGDLQTITTPDTTVVVPTANNINFVNGVGIDITGSGSDITFAVTAPPTFVDWSVITAATKAMVVDEGYFANAGGGVTFTFPAVAALGDVFYISSINAGGWTLAQNAGQSVRIGSSITTTGVGGSLASTAIGDSIFIVCAVANTSFVVVSSMGNITVV